MRVSLFFSALLWFAGHMGTFAELLGRKGTDRRPDPGKPELPGAQVHGSNRGKTRLPGAADPDKSFILCHAFRYGTGTCETSFYLQATVLPFFLYLRIIPWVQIWLQPRRRGDRTRSLSPLHPPRAREWSSKVRGAARPVARRKTFILIVTRIRSLSWGPPTNEKPGKHPFFIKKHPT